LDLLLILYEKLPGPNNSQSFKKKTKQKNAVARIRRNQGSPLLSTDLLGIKKDQFPSKLCFSQEVKKPAIVGVGHDGQ